MTTVYCDIFRAIHEGKWLAIEYRNQSDTICEPEKDDRDGNSGREFLCEAI